MTPYYADDWLTVYAGDCRDVLPTLAADSVDCIVTSPPYWGLRDYGTATWSGGDADCDHKQNNYDRGVLTTQEDGAPNKMSAATAEKRRTPYLHLCGKCGATRQDAQLGLEATPELYVANLVAVFRELRRVLKPSGTCWLNLGDSYSGARSEGGGTMAGFNDRYFGRDTDGGKQATTDTSKPARPAVVGLKPKDLVGIPWRVAFALQADGWYLRSDIIWAKPNPMPESVTDRPTKAHEYLFLLTKNARYFYDADAVREAVDWITPEGRFGRNLRSVWTIATRPYPGAHFAVFPPELPERCIKAGSSERGVCPECGAPWERVVELGTVRSTGGSASGARASNMNTVSPLGQNPERSAYNTGTFVEREHVTRGWRRSCGHPRWMFEGDNPADEIFPSVEPAVVLDPFAGSGTVGLVAQKLNRRAILIDLNPDYILQAMQRNAQTPLGLGA